MKKNPPREGFDFVREMWGIIFMSLGMFFALSLISYSPTDPALNAASDIDRIRNLCGIVGAYTADILFTFFGISAYVASLLFFTLSLMQFFGKSISLRLKDIFFYIGLISFVSSLIHLRFETLAVGNHEVAGGGVLGGLIGGTLARYLNRPGAYVISTSGVLIFFLWATRLSVVDLVDGLRRAIAWCGINLWQLLSRFATQTPLLMRKLFSAGRRACHALPSLFQGLHTRLFQRAGQKRKKVEVHLPPRPQGALVTNALQKAADPATATVAADDDGDEGHLETAAGPKILKRTDIKQKRLTDAQLKFLQMNDGKYTPPPLSLLDSEDRPKIEVDEGILKKNSLLLEKKLKDFEVEGQVTAIHPGPVITMYEFEPSPGTKVNKVVNLEDDLSLTLGGRSVRIIPHLPGKAAVGIEVPNREREVVWLKDIIASEAYQKSQQRIPLALGTDTEGQPKVTDLTKMPHLLIAGATGSGKSVCINSLIISLLYKLSPEKLKLIMIDPKMLELSLYEGIPHLLLPVVTRPKQAIVAMRWAVKEMERRYRLMADSGARNIVGYNEKIEKGKLTLVSEEEAKQRLEADREAIAHTGQLPYLVIIIDELADLMMTSSQEMEETVTRIAQMARAAGIHLILATQRPSVDVVTGLIKANFPARISFKVSARHDSRTILDSIGAEQLLGNGDMLFMSPSGDGINRHHGCLVTEAEIGRLVSHLKQQGQPIYDESILAQPDPGAEGVDESFDDEDIELYDKAVAIVTETRQASISMVQRRLRIGYNRAARLIERMEAEGVIGPAEGSKPRQVIAQAMEKQ